MRKSLSIVKRDGRVISPSYTRSYPMVVERGKGAWLWDTDGRKYLDFTAGIAVANVGHANPDVVNAVRSQALKILHNAGTDFYNELEVGLAEKLVKVTPGRFPKRVFFTNSGTESVECAFKLARYYTKKPRLISFIGAFHGRTYGSMTLSSSKLRHRDHFGPLVPMVTHTPYPYCYRCPMGKEAGQCGMECLRYLEDELLRHVVPSDEVAAVIVEPIQGEGGYIVPPRGFHKELQGICKSRGFLYMADEVQTGFGRTGRMFASEHFGVQPDVMCLAKGIAAGMPLGACVARKDVMDWPPGAHASTFSGNPLSCAAAHASLDCIRKRRLAENADALGRAGLKRLEEMASDIPLIGDVRGKGLMLAIELVKDGESREPAPEAAAKVAELAFRKGLLLLTCGESAVRVVPPLVITKKELMDGMGVLEECLRTVSRLGHASSGG
jgi:4-aminobutyrate aminotransferase